MLFACLPEEELEYLRQRFNENEPYFCIIEDFIQGCNLAQYCHGDARRNIPAHCPKKDADYAQVQAYEKMIFTWKWSIALVEIYHIVYGQIKAQIILKKLLKQ